MEARTALVRSLATDIRDQRVLDALSRVRREAFVEPELREHAYEDRPLPIGHGQTISQPRMVAIMLQELGLRGHERVLEVGGGSGYQAALLAELAREVVSVELLPELVGKARQTLLAEGYERVAFFQAGHQLGWPELAPYDAIIVAAASPRVPQGLIDQLGRGRLVIPVGDRREQDLIVVERRPEGLVVTNRGPCRFVPLLGQEAYGAPNGA